MKLQLTYRSALIGTTVLLILLITYTYFIQNSYLTLYHKVHNFEQYYESVTNLTHTTIVMVLLFMATLLALLLRSIDSREDERIEKNALSNLYDESQRYFDNAAVGFIAVDDQRIITNVNAKFCEIFGYTRNELIGNSAEMLHIDHSHFKRWGVEVFEQARHSKTVLVRYPMRRSDGSQIWIDVSGAPLDKSKRLPGGEVLWTVIEVSDKVRASTLLERYNRRLQENLEYVTGLINTAPIPLYIKNTDSRYQECNDAFLELVNRTKKEIIGKTDEEIFDIFVAEALAKKERALLEEKHKVYKLRFMFDTEAKVMEFYTSAIIMDKKLKGYIGFCVDVTEKESRELYLNQRIEQEVMRNLAMQKQHFEERTNDAKFAVLGKLAAGMTHEINTPLTYVKGNIEMAQMGLESLEPCENRDYIKQDLLRSTEGIKRIESIVASMREMSQQSGEIQEEINIFETIMTAVTLGYNRSKHIAIITLQGQPFEFGMKITDAECKVLMQKQRIEQVWVIILNNALDELEHNSNFDESLITIECKSDGDTVTIRFEDTGRGIPKEIIGHMFDPFVSKKEYGGIGIGLNIAKKIVADHHGIIKAYNGEKGAVFEVTLPTA